MRRRVLPTTESAEQREDKAKQVARTFRERRELARRTFERAIGPFRRGRLRA